MPPDYQQIAELFGLEAAQPDEVEWEETASDAGEVGVDALTKGTAKLSDGDYEAAVEHFQRAVEHQEGDPRDALIGLATAQEMLGDSPAAFRQFRMAQRMHAKDPDPLVGLSDLYLRDGNLREALRELEAAIRAEPYNPYFHLKVAEALRSRGKLAEADTAAQQAVLLAPDQAFYHYWRGDLALERRQYLVALDCLRAAIELSPGDDHLLVRAALAFWGAERPVDAIKAMRLASDLDPEKLPYYALLADFLRSEGRIDEADTEAKRAGELDRYDRDFWIRLRREAGFKDLELE